MTGRTGVLALLVAAGVLGLVVSAQSWWRASGDGTTVAFSGADATGNLSQALPAVLLAGALLVLVLRTTGRQVLAVLLASAALGMVVVGVLRPRPGDDAVRTRLRQVSLVEQFGLGATLWPWVYALAGALALVGAVLLWRGAARWPERGNRFERYQPAAEPADDPAEAWRALDAGRDPTDDPDVRSTGAGDTMDAQHTIPSTRADTHHGRRNEDA